MSLVRFAFIEIICEFVCLIGPSVGYIHGAMGNVGGAQVDWCIAEIFSARECAHGTSP